MCELSDLAWSGAAMKLLISPTQRTFRGSNVVLGCTFLVDGPSVEPSSFIIKWYFKRKEILTFSSEGLIIHPRMSFNAQTARNGDASLYISNVTIFDDGTYTCSVMYKMEQKEKNTQLQIMASPKVMITNKVVTENKASTMTCTATEFYPPDIKITWLGDEQLLQNSELGEITLNDDRTFSVLSTVTITPSDGDRDRTFSCRVLHTSLLEPMRKDFQLDIQKDLNIGLIVGIICAVFILLATLLGIFFYMRHRSAPQTAKIQQSEPDEMDQLCPPEDNVIMDNQQQHPSPQEAYVREEPEADVREESDDIRNDCMAPTDPCLPHIEESSVIELDDFEVIHKSELYDYP
ncbi:PREDICTED: tapasin-related protein-like [Nanorana parkeri]|uniref:tapasin-related protein-like n=1 Tax=Nanorana parkeri TaxID=125878 RepID=UPI0008546B49|nr:PREDICTED: tapasin-related protein-like [Nanorana parkeri]